MRLIYRLSVALYGLVSLLLLAPRDARAHEGRIAQIAIDAISTNDALVTIREPIGAHLAIEPGPGCRLETRAGPGLVLRCRESLAGQVLVVTGMGAGADVAFVTMTGDRASLPESTVVTASATEITLPGTPARSGVVVRYVRIGAGHVLSGLDHVLFIVALFWQAWAASRGSPRRMARELGRTATAFTVAHSVTLIATSMGVLRLPQAVAEACIALSLVLVALDVGGPRAAEGWGAARAASSRSVLAAAFGLVHGLGFAGSLSTTRLPSGAQWTALFAFNVGVECGQIVLFAMCALVLAIVVRLASRRDEVTWSSPQALVQRLVTVSAYGVGITGATLLFLRISSIFF